MRRILTDRERCRHFQINATTGLITANLPADDVQAGPSCTLKITASDSGQPRRQTAHHITVTSFQTLQCRETSPPLNISFTIEENTPPGSIVGYLSADEYFDDINSDDDVMDINSNGRTKEVGKAFWLVAGNALDTFHVDSTTGALVIGSAVDFEVCSSYHLVVRILDGVGKCVRELFVEVVVVNVNDNPPHFDVDLTYITVREATPPDAEVYAATAHDADGSALSYAMWEERSSEGVASWLAVDGATGHVVTRRSLEGAPRQMHVVITANDIPGHQASMTLVVTVAKDAFCGPVGSAWSQRVAVVEDAEVGSVIAAFEKADDSVPSSCNYSITYRLANSSSDYDKFAVDRLTGEFPGFIYRIFG